MAPPQISSRPCGCVGVGVWGVGGRGGGGGPGGTEGAHGVGGRLLCGQVGRYQGLGPQRARRKEGVDGLKVEVAVEVAVGYSCRCLYLLAAPLAGRQAGAAPYAPQPCTHAHARERALCICPAPPAHLLQHAAAALAELAADHVDGRLALCAALLVKADVHHLLCGLEPAAVHRGQVAGQGRAGQGRAGQVGTMNMAERAGARVMPFHAAAGAAKQAAPH